jgi:hypothetical protein
MRRLLFIAIIALISFSCNNSGSATESSDSAAVGTDSINSLNETGSGTGSDTMSGTGKGTGMDTTGRGTDTTGRSDRTDGHDSATR